MPPNHFAITAETRHRVNWHFTRPQNDIRYRLQYSFAEICFVFADMPSFAQHCRKLRVLKPVETVQVFKSHVQSVRCSRRYIYAVVHATDSLDNALIKVTPVFNQSFFQMIFDVINVLVSATSTSARLAVCRSSRIKLSIMYMHSTCFTEARDQFFSRKVSH